MLSQFLSMWTALGRKWRTRRHSCRRRPQDVGRRSRPFLELLEDRVVPSVVFRNSFDPGPSSSIIDLGGPVVAHVQVQTVFWGTFWDSNPQMVQDIRDKVLNILNDPYLSGLA